MDKQARSVQLNVKIAPCMKRRITALATAREISITGLLMRVLDACASPEVGDGLDNYKLIDFAWLLALGWVACFFGRQIEASPGYRLSQRRRRPHSESGVYLHDLKGNTQRR